MRVAQLMASPFVGGPERQVLGLAEALRPDYDTVFLSFAEGGRSRPFLDEARRRGFEAVELAGNAPRVFRAAGEIALHLRRTGAAVLCCNGYKPDVVGWMAGRRAGVPVVGIAHGWTAATWKVRLNEAIDRRVMRHMDAVVCVSEAQAVRVRRAGVDPARVHVIRNAIDADAFGRPDPACRRLLEGMFTQAPQHIVAAGGRLSPEKGFDLYVDAAAEVARRDAEAGFVLFGDGPLREALEQRVRRHGLEGRFVLAGFRSDLRHLWPCCDLAVLSSHTEGLPVVVLEALAAGVPVVATAVGGTPEVIEDGRCGRLIPPGDVAALADGIGAALDDTAWRRQAGEFGRRRVREQFSFEGQADRYRELFEQLIGGEEFHQPDASARKEPLAREEASAKGSRSLAYASGWCGGGSDSAREARP
jgi:glycosyltransferase involved in cell wall biosynthesis